MPEPERADDLTTMELLDAIKSTLYLLMAATDKLSRLFRLVVLRRRQELRDQRPLPPDETPADE